MQLSEALCFLFLRKTYIAERTADTTRVLTGVESGGHLDLHSEHLQVSVNWHSYFYSGRQGMQVLVAFSWLCSVD